MNFEAKSRRAIACFPAIPASGARPRAGELLRRRRAPAERASALTCAIEEVDVDRRRHRCVRECILRFSFFLFFFWRGFFVVGAGGASEEGVSRWFQRGQLFPTAPLPIDVLALARVSSYSFVQFYGLH